MPTPINNTTAATTLIDIVQRFKDGIITEAAAAAETKTLLDNWTYDTVNAAQLGTRLSSTLGNWDSFTKGQLDWLTTPADGGDYGDGDVDLVDYLGVTTRVPGLIKLQSVIQKGDRGAEGASVGQVFVLAGGTAAADPGNGKIKFNADQTRVYIDNLNAGGADVTALIDSWDDEPTAVRIQLVFRQIDSDKVGTLNVVGDITSATSYRTIPTEVVGPWPSFDVGARISVATMFTTASLAEVTSATDLATEKAALAQDKADYAQEQGDAAALVVASGADILAAVPAAQTARAGAENAQALTAGYFSGLSKPTQASPAAFVDEYGFAQMIIDLAGVMRVAGFAATAAAIEQVTGVRTIKTASSADAPLGVTDEYGIGVFSVSADSLMSVRAMEAVEAAIQRLKGVTRITTPQTADAPLGVVDEYGVGIMSVSSGGLLRTFSAILNDLTSGTITATSGTIGTLTAGSLTLSQLALEILRTQGGEYGLAVVDAYGAASAKIDGNGLTTTGVSAKTVTADQGQFAKVGLSAITSASGNYELAVVDEYGFARTIFDSTGVRAPNITTMQQQIAAGAKVYRGVWDYELNLYLGDGQSLSTGYNAKPALSTVQPYGSLMLSGGVRTTLTDYTGQTLVPLVEATGTNEGETPIAGALQQINALIASENGIAYDQHAFALIGAAAGIPGASITAMVKPSTGYSRKTAVMAQVASQAATLNKTFAVRAIDWTQGETDTQNGMAFETYITYLRGLRTDIDTDAKALTGQTVDVEMFTYQTSSHSNYGIATPTIALAQLEASKRDAHIHMVCPIYFMPGSDGVHLTNTSSKWLGAYKGLVYKRVVIDGAAWKPLAPKSKIIQGKTCILVFDVPEPPLVFDTVSVVDPGQYGFDLVDSSGTSLTVSSISLAGPDRVKIVAAAAIPSGAKVRYAWKPGPTVGSGPVTGPRGCLRDVQGDKLPVFDPAGIAKRLHNWCVIFEI